MLILKANVEMRHNFREIISDDDRTPKGTQLVKSGLQRKGFALGSGIKAGGLVEKE